ncbi:hypothetical protein AC804_08525 [Chryseobacterium sp. Hurlbut01]|nr:hypothetical protein AC804_08525 [Chryseobacterium sp. Hurlbut01]
MNFILLGKFQNIECIYNFLEFFALNKKYQDKTFEVILENYRRMNQNSCFQKNLDVNENM